jgi:hypothetical protein
MSDALAAAVTRIEKLEARLEGLQRHFDMKPPMTFAGDWQSLIAYAPATVVRFGDSLYCSIRPIHAGKAEPSRGDGTGWERLVKGLRND